MVDKTVVSVKLFEFTVEVKSESRQTAAAVGKQTRNIKLKGDTSCDYEILSGLLLDQFEGNVTIPGLLLFPSLFLPLLLSLLLSESPDRSNDSYNSGEGEMFTFSLLGEDESGNTSASP